MSELRLLLPGPAVVGDLERHHGEAVQALADLYAYPDPVPAHGYVRANMIASLDGSARDAAGSSRGISGRADQTVLGVLRALADVVVVGARTARTEDYRPLPARRAFAERRGAAGQAPAAVVAVVTASGDLDPDSPLWAPGAASLVMTCEAAPLARVRAVAGYERVIVAGEDRVDPVRAVAALVDRGLRRLLVEGGPTLLGAVAAAGVLDELCLTWSPLMVGGDGPRIAHGTPAELRLRAAHLLEAGGLLLGRWTVVPARA